jgi:hypothetical protein
MDVDESRTRRTDLTDDADANDGRTDADGRTDGRGRRTDATRIFNGRTDARSYYADGRTTDGR